MAVRGKMATGLVNRKRMALWSGFGIDLIDTSLKNWRTFHVLSS
jgi:hypothetical protein